jgi:hypothetical protein
VHHREIVDVKRGRKMSRRCDQNHGNGTVYTIHTYIRKQTDSDMNQTRPSLSLGLRNGIHPKKQRAELIRLRFHVRSVVRPPNVIKKKKTQGRRQNQLYLMIQTCLRVRTRCGSSKMCGGMPRPTRNSAMACAQLLQLLLSKLYVSALYCGEISL